MSVCQLIKRTILICVYERYQIGRQNTKHGTDLENFSERRWEGRTNFAPGCTQKECARSNDIVTSHRDMFESRISVEAKEKPTHKSFRETWCRILFFLVLRHGGHAKKCVVANETTHKISKSQRHAWITTFFNDEKMSQLENCLHFPPKLFSNVCIWFELEQNGQKLATNVCRDWSLALITHVSTDNVVVWEKHSTKVQDGIFSRLWFPRRSRRLKIDIRRSSVHFRSHVCAKINFAAKKQNIDPMWKVPIKELIWKKHGCTQRQCEISKDIVDNYRTMFESRNSAGRAEKLPFPQNLRISSWSYDMDGYAKKCMERYCELANKTTQQLYKVSAPCIDDHHIKEKEMRSVGEFVTCMLSNRSEMLVLGTNWTTWYSMVSEQTCMINC